MQSDMKHWPFTVINDSSRPKVQVEYKGETKTFYPEEISSMVLTKMKEIAEAYLGKVGFLSNTMPVFAIMVLRNHLPCCCMSKDVDMSNLSTLTHVSLLEHERGLFE